MRHTTKHLIKRYSFYFGGDQPEVSWRESLRACSGVVVGLILVFTIAKLLGELTDIDEWLMASLGASAFLAFVLPGSPMAQPWAVIAGNTLSALIGITSFIFIPESLIAMSIAVSLSIMGMFVLRCLHPPAAAVALIAVLGHITNYLYALFPVLLDSLLLVVVAGIYSNLTGKQYPNRPN